MTTLHPGFLWGAATAPHQIEGNNLNSDFWHTERMVPGFERSGDACDSYHRYAQDMRPLAEAGLTAYRFGIEWARVEPEEGQFSRAELDHYRRMIDTAFELGLEPVITLQHFTVPRWFAESGNWLAPQAIDRFRRYVERAATVLSSVDWVITMNEPNIYGLLVGLADAVRSGRVVDLAGIGSTTAFPAVSAELADRLIQAHHAAREILKGQLDAGVGWTVAAQALTTTPGNEDKHAEVYRAQEGRYLEAARGDDFVGVQSYTSQPVDENGIAPHPPHPDNTLTGWAYRPDALGIAVRQTWETTGGVPILVTENGIATADDERRIDYTTGALRGLYAAIDDGIDVRGYLHWSAIDNYEWGHWAPTFGLVAVDRETFLRTPRPSLGWLGEVARGGGRLPTR